MAQISEFENLDHLTRLRVFTKDGETHEGLFAGYRKVAGIQSSYSADDPGESINLRQKPSDAPEDEQQISVELITHWTITEDGVDKID